MNTSRTIQILSTTEDPKNCDFPTFLRKKRKVLQINITNLTVLFKASSVYVSNCNFRSF